MSWHPLSALNAVKDPRIYQITVLSSLLIYGVEWLDFEVNMFQAVVILATALATQYSCTGIWKLAHFDPRSALISGLSLCLLLRTNLAVLAVLATVITISSKFVIRYRGKHVFNPTNFGLVAMMVFSDEVWISSGQWGTSAILAFLFAGLGGLVVQRAQRSDVTYAFLCFYSLLLLSRSWWLGDPMSIPLHRLQNGALLLFTFFMISDPKTTPDSRPGRILFALLVALGAAYIQFSLYRTNSFIWSLAAMTFAVPFIDRWLPGQLYQWPGRQAALISMDKGVVYEKRDSSSPAGLSDVATKGSELLRLLRLQGRHKAVQQGLSSRLGS